ncbi:hypothetical protein [Caldalkalibacillus mannanilyticus]|uniref:hypothetical protein n=1 Tax=Caldalkalibacillus mannanilyticus TaxID=1418 RepID=UPI0004682C74|nr:hypothetical protein [Caldalkalibacillus mannanilyticus]
MKLSEYLLYRDIQELSQMASLYRCDCNVNSKLELVQSIHHSMMSKNAYPSILKELDKNVLHFLLYILYQNTSTFSIDELMAKAKYVRDQFQSEESPRTWITQLLKRGWLFPSSSRFQVQLDMADDLNRLLRSQIMDYIKQEYQISTRAELDLSYRDEGKAIQYDVGIFLAHIAKEPVPITVEGVIHKRNQQLLLKKLSVEEELILDKSWRFGYGRRFPAYPNRFSLIYDFCFAQKWIEEEAGGYVTLSYLGDKALEQEEWKLPSTFKRMVMFWVKLYKQPIPSLPFLILLVNELTQGEWIDTIQLFNVTKPWLKKYYYDEIETIYRERFLQMLVHLGLLHMTVEKQGQPVYCRLNPILIEEIFKS